MCELCKVLIAYLPLLAYVTIVFTILFTLFSLTHCLLLQAQTITVHFLLMTHCLNAALCHSSFVSYLQRLPQRSLVLTHKWPRLMSIATFYLVYKPPILVVVR